VIKIKISQRDSQKYKPTTPLQNLQQRSQELRYTNNFLTDETLHLKLSLSFIVLTTHSIQIHNHRIQNNSQQAFKSQST